MSRVSAGVPGQGAGPLLAGGHRDQGGHLRHQDQPGLAGEAKRDLYLTIYSIYLSNYLCIHIMLLQATIIRNYFVKTQTSVASFCPPDLSIIFSNGMYLEVSPL